MAEPTCAFGCAERAFTSAIPLLVFVGACVPPGPAVRQAQTSIGHEHSELRAELLEMVKLDQECRTKGTDMSLPEEERQSWIDRAGPADRAHTARMKQIVARFGWPTRSLVGEDGARAAFLLVQHADHDPGFQESCLPLLEEGAARGEVKRSSLAYLTDRVRGRQNRPQLYGTQYSVRTLADGSVALRESGGVEYMLPLVEDVDRLDDRRTAAGLGPWIEYERQMAKLQGRQPADAPRVAK